MTKPKPLPEIARCACGRVALVCGGYLGPAKEVSCQCGWSGPIRQTQRGAILAWNRVMGQPISVAEIAERARIRFNRKAKKATDKIRRGE